MALLDFSHHLAEAAALGLQQAGTGKGRSRVRQGKRYKQLVRVHERYALKRLTHGVCASSLERLHRQ